MFREIKFGIFPCTDLGQDINFLYSLFMVMLFLLRSATSLTTRSSVGANQFAPLQVKALFCYICKKSDSLVLHCASLHAHNILRHLCVHACMITNRKPKPAVCSLQLAIGPYMGFRLGGGGSFDLCKHVFEGAMFVKIIACTFIYIYIYIYFFFFYFSFYLQLMWYLTRCYQLNGQILALFYEPIKITLLAHRIFKRFTYVIFE